MKKVKYPPINSFLIPFLIEVNDDFDEDYERKELDRLDEELAKRHNDHREYQLSGKIDKADETKAEKMMRRKIEKGKRQMELQLDNANFLEMAKYNNKDVRPAELSESEDTDDILDARLLKKVEKIEKVNQKHQKITEDQEFINPLNATKKDIKRMKAKNAPPAEKVAKKEKVKAKVIDSDESEPEIFDSDADDLADQLDKGKL
jgi:hypothetical protein